MVAPVTPARPSPGPVSVVLCTWNGERWVDELLRSIAAQTLRPTELIISDDASDDGTLAVVDARRPDLPFDVTVMRNRDRLGSTKNFERALGRAQGRVVALADQDDVWYPHKLARLVGELALDPTVSMAFSDADLIGEDGEPIGASLWATRRVERPLRSNPVVPVEVFARRAVTTGCTMVVRRRAVQAALPLPDVLDDPVAVMRHDRWLSLVAAAVGTARAVPERLLGFRVHPGQETGVLLDGPQRRTALGRAALGVAQGRDEPREHDVRALQLQAAADRADDFGDFESARALRDEADHHRFRARVARGQAHVGQVAAATWKGRYGAYGLGASAALADGVRALRGATR